MKSIKFICTLLLVCSTVCLQAQNSEKEQLTVALSSPGKPYKLKVNLISGSIRVTGHNADNIVIDVDVPEEKGGRKDKRAGESGMKRIGGSTGYEVKAIEKNNEVTVHTNLIDREVNLELKVPANGSLILKTINGGDIEVKNVKGELELNNINGEIKLSGIAGSAVATTVNGDIVARFESVTPDKPMAFSTFNGTVDISLPAVSKANLKLKSDQGDIFSDFDVAIEKGSGGTSKTNSGGLYRIAKDAWVTGKINGGGAELMVKSNMGDIYIRKAKQ
ncbi:MAG: DUF4097 domain-containing protein [Chitinophagaceae bacterium]|nr:DUF4097 domain-containing protein [Chitinophagaceae bacterium]